MIHDINKSDKYFYFHINQDMSVTGYAGYNKYAQWFIWEAY